MMKRNYFGKLLAIAMVFAGFSLTSCDENDNAIIDGKVWVKPEVQLVDGGAIIKGSSTKDINTMLGRVSQQIIEAADNGDQFTIDIQTPVLNSTADDNTLIIAAVKGGDVVLNLPSNIVTEVPLIIQAMGVADDTPPAAASTNEVEINIPSGSSNIDLGINMPSSTVTLKGGTIENLAAKTALATLVIENGVTVNWLKMLGGRAEVKDGGKVLGYLFDGDEQGVNNTDAYINKNGVNPFWGLSYPGVYYLEGETEKAYYTQNLKVVKGESAYANVYIDNALAEKALESLIIEDGAGVRFSYSGSNDPETGLYLPPKGINLVEGSGNKTAKIYSDGLDSYTDEKGKTLYSGWIYLDDAHINEIKNVTVDLTTLPNAYIYDNETHQWVSLGTIEISQGNIWLANVCTDCDIKGTTGIYGHSLNNKERVMSKISNCTLTCSKDEATITRVEASNSKLSADRIYDVSANSETTTFTAISASFTNQYISENSATLKNCKFESSAKEPTSTITLPYQTDKRSSFNFKFDGCQLASNYKLTTSFPTNRPWLDKDGNVVTKAYYWYDLEEDGETLKPDAVERRSYDEKDIPAANKTNGENATNLSGQLIGYRVYENSSGISEPVDYKDFKCYITFNSTTIGGKTITDKTDFIKEGKSSIANRYDSEGKAVTTTYFVIESKNYEALYNANTNKWNLLEAE